MNHKYLNPAQVVADSISNLHTNNLTTFPKAGLSKDERIEVIEECATLFNEIKNSNLDFITDTLASHVIILNNVVSTCHKKSKSGTYFREYTELSIKASDQLRKSGLALAQIKNVIINIENLNFQQNNHIQLNAGKPTHEVAYDKTMVTA
jgi:hypothetical protein